MRIVLVLARLAWRYLWRNHRRTIVMLSAISVGAWAMMFMTALTRGMVDQIIEDGVSGRIVDSNPAALADALTSAGVGVLRYDDRGVGGSTGDYNAATVQELAFEAYEAGNRAKPVRFDREEHRADVDRLLEALAAVPALRTEIEA